MRVLASVLAFDFSNIGSQIEKLEKSGIDGFHFDIMDGLFVPNFSFGYDLIDHVRKISSLNFSTHLMIKEPIKYLKKFIDAGTDEICFHIESDSNPYECIELVKKYRKKVGLALNPETKIETIVPFISKIDTLLVMTVNPGFGGQKFCENQISKIKQIKENINSLNKNLIIEVDGGINKETSKIVKRAGAASLISGSFILKSNDYKKSINNLR